MENRTASVYECTLAVEAHMICDLLSQAGIAARVDGAFLAGAGGELPLGNTVKVRVAPERVTEAREVIADWEKQQTDDVVPPVTAQPRVKAFSWFAVGALVGGAFAFVMVNMATRDDNGRPEQVWLSENGVLTQVDHYFESSGHVVKREHFRDGLLDSTEYDMTATEYSSAVRNSMHTGSPDCRTAPNFKHAAR